jgi:hypothetical protein
LGNLPRKSQATCAPQLFGAPQSVNIFLNHARLQHNITTSPQKSQKESFLLVQNESLREKVIKNYRFAIELNTLDSIPIVSYLYGK